MSGLSNNKPLNTFSLEQSLYYGKNLFQNLVRSGATGKDIVQVIDVLIAGINKQIGLDCYVGDVNACNLDEQTKLCYILNSHLEQMNQLLAGLNQLRLQVQGSTGSAGSGSSSGAGTAPGVSDSYFLKVKNDAEEVAGPLIDKLKSNQPNGLLYDATAKTLNAGTFIPPGSIFMISKRYLVNFDSTGLGKVSTDFYPFAIADGRNGTDNLLKDVYLKFLSNINDADQEGGLDGFTVKQANIESMSFGITGAINEALASTGLKVEMAIQTGGIGGMSGTFKFYIVRDPSTFSHADVPVTPPDGAKHSHTHTLSATHVNQAPVPIPLNPKYIKLVPIQTIKR
jgi:hypothetical protein